MKSSYSKVLLFDGVCHLCNGFIQFIVKNEVHQSIQFAPIQSEAAIGLDKTYNFDDPQRRSIIYIRHGIVLKRSSAVLQVLIDMGGIWKVIGALGRFFPVSIRDFIYNRVAKNRYKWFGKRDTCMVPTSDLEKRFLR